MLGELGAAVSRTSIEGFAQTLRAEGVTRRSPEWFGRAFERSVRKDPRLFCRVAVGSQVLAAGLDVTELKRIVPAALEAAGPPRVGEGYGPRRGFALLVLTRLVSDLGRRQWNVAMAGLTELTSRFTAEFDVRWYVERDPSRAVEWSLALVRHSNPHVRRLACEGLRPRLPWATHLEAFKSDPRPLIPILEALRSDPSPYVRRSVGNCLGDIVKDNAVGLELVEDWVTRGTADSLVIRRALRYPIAKGNSRAILLAGAATRWVNGPPNALDWTRASSHDESDQGFVRGGARSSRPPRGVPRSD